MPKKKKCILLTNVEVFGSTIIFMVNYKTKLTDLIRYQHRKSYDKQRDSVDQNYPCCAGK